MAKQEMNNRQKSNQQQRPRQAGTPQGDQVQPAPERKSQPLSRSQQRRRASKRAQRPWWSGPVPLIGSVVAVVAVVTIFIVVANQGPASYRQPATAAVVRQVTNVSPAVINAVGGGTLASTITFPDNHTLPAGAPLPTSFSSVSSTPLSVNGKPEILYIGGEFCPICAADRWSLVNALSRFGTFSNLQFIHSAADDGDLASFTFYGSGYTSNYIDFTGIENEDRSQNQLSSLTDQQTQLLTTLGGSGYPFVDVAGVYVNKASDSYPGGYDPSVLTGESWAQIAGALSNASSPITQGIIGGANHLTAAICKVTHNQPGSVCKVRAIQTLESQLQ